MFHRTKVVLMLLAVALAASAGAWAAKTREATVGKVVKTSDGPGLQFEVCHARMFGGFDWGTMTMSAHSIVYDSETKPDQSFHYDRRDLIGAEHRKLGNIGFKIQFRGHSEEIFMAADVVRRKMLHDDAPILAALNNFDSALAAANGPASASQAASTGEAPPLAGAASNGGGESNVQIASSAPLTALPTADSAAPQNAPTQAVGHLTPDQERAIATEQQSPQSAAADRAAPQNAPMQAVGHLTPDQERAIATEQQSAAPAAAERTMAEMQAAPRPQIAASAAAAPFPVSTNLQPVVQPRLFQLPTRRVADRDASLAVVRAVLDADPDPNQISGALYFLTDGDGTGPEIAKLLLARGANVNTTMFYNVTPLMMVIARSCGALFAHALVEDPREAKRTPCSPAEVTQVVGVLLDHGARMDVRDTVGATPLMRAAETGDLEVVQLLVTHGADLSAKDNKGHSALQYAKDGRGIELASTGRKRGKGNEDVIRFFEERGLKN